MAKQEVHEILARRHGFDPKLEESFEDWDTIEDNKRVAKIFDGMDYFLGVVGVITLALGAIGIINIMLVSVTERTREIGLRKALGATHRAILTQFFVEGAFLTALSGGIGLAITTALVTVLAALPRLKDSTRRASSRRPRQSPFCRWHLPESPRDFIQRAKPRCCSRWRLCARSNESARITMILELARQAYNALKYNRRRSILTMLGMAWGIATVVLLLAYGSGFERGLWVAFRSWGTNLVFIFPGRTSLQAGGTKAGSEIKLTVNDLDYLQAEVPLLKRISPEAAKQSTVAYRHAERQLRHQRSLSLLFPHAPHARSKTAVSLPISTKTRAAASPSSAPT